MSCKQSAPVSRLLCPRTLVIDKGWLHTNENVSHCLSPNFDARPKGAAGNVSLLVIHNISLPPGQFGGCYIHNLFCNQLDPAVHPYFNDIYTLKVSALPPETGRS